MQPEDYKNRFYRLWQHPDDLIEFNLSYKESDITVFAKANLFKVAKSFLIECRKPIEETIKNHPEFKTSLKPIYIESPYPIIKAMIEKSFSANVGPMAGVAGAIAQCLGAKLLKYSDELIIENGGDIFIKSRTDRILKIYPGEDSPFKDKLKILLKGRSASYGVCTSSKSIGHSLNFGKTDATVIISKSAITSDMFATSISNLVKSENDLEKVIKYAENINVIEGGLIAIGNKAAVWGDIEFV